MTHLLVNGIEVAIQNDHPGSLRELIQKIRTDYSTESSLISSIRVNGVEIDAQDESVIGNVPVDQLRSIEVFTAHPREIAEDTLQALIEFSTHLEKLCHDISSELLESPPKVEKLQRLADGITTFIDALSGVKQILHVGNLSVIQVLEADLLSILKDVFEYQKKSEFHFAATVIREALVANLTQWRTEGIPSLIRLRDS
jgi:hypothetical protein